MASVNEFWVTCRDNPLVNAMYVSMWYIIMLGVSDNTCVQTGYY